MKRKFEHSVAINQEEFEKGNLIETFETEEEAKAYAESIGADAVVVDVECDDVR